MVIEVIPHERDDFNNLARLTIIHEHGKLTTPARMINRYDLNAKDNAGVNIPLMQDSHAFMFQEKINSTKLESIMNKNGFLYTMRMAGRQVLNKIDDQNLKLFYPSLTKECEPQLLKYTDQQKFELVKFLCNTAKEINLKSIILPVIYNLTNLAADVSKTGLQLIPSLTMTIDKVDFKKQIDSCMEIGSHIIPLLVVQFATYAKANQAYDYLGKKFDALHEKNQAVMVVDTQRVLHYEAYKSVSAPHYGAFLTADLSAEIYRSAGGGTNNNIRIFSKDNLSLPKTNGAVSFDPQVEKTVFKNDVQLQELFVRIATNTTNDDDWVRGLPRSVARIHEVIRSHPEFTNLSRSIRDNSARDYLKEKSDMNEVLTRELELE